MANPEVKNEAKQPTAVELSKLVVSAIVTEANSDSEMSSSVDRVVAVVECED